MPYFVYYVTQHTDSSRKSLEHLETFDNFKSARTLARERRADLKESGDRRDCRLIFAKNQVEAERLLSAPRDERVVGED
jgi:pimeloyl-CoA synthetase